MTYPVPDNVPPLTDELVCFCVYAPNDQQYINILSGAIFGLGLWINYDRTTDKAGVRVGQVWQGINGQMSICGTTTIEFRQEPGCVLEFRQDGGAWSAIYDPSSCIPEPPDLSDYLIRHPLTNARNLISTDGVLAYAVSTSNTLYAASHDLRGAQMLYSSLLGQLIDGERYRQIFNLQRPGEHSAAPLITSLVVDAAYDVPLLNGWSETGTRRYASLADLSTPDSSHSGAFVIVHDNTYDRDDLYISEQKSDASYQWKKWFTQQDAIAVLGDVWGAVDTAYEELPVGSTPEITFEPVTPTVNPPRTLVTLKTPPFSAAPPSDTCPDVTPPDYLSERHYMMQIDAQGTAIPFGVPANTVMNNVTARGKWNIHTTEPGTSDTDVIVNPTGDTSHVVDGLARGQLQLRWYPDNGAVYSFTVPPTNAFAGRTAATNELWFLEANTTAPTLGQVGVRGQICVEFDLVRASPYAWTISAIFTEPVGGFANSFVSQVGATPDYNADGYGGNCVYDVRARINANFQNGCHIRHAAVRASWSGENVTLVRYEYTGNGYGVHATNAPTSNSGLLEQQEWFFDEPYDNNAYNQDWRFTISANDCDGGHSDRYMTRLFSVLIEGDGPTPTLN